MITIDIPSYKRLTIEHLVLDYNGTIACDGKILDGVKKRLTALARQLQIHVLTADTFGAARSNLQEVPCRLTILPPGKQDKGKLSFVRSLGPDHTACIGNGMNDRLMLSEAALGIAVVLEEGASARAISSADIVCTSIISALDMFTNPLRIIATLRS